jgi:murein L,D-transpeptidase YafK
MRFLISFFAALMILSSVAHAKTVIKYVPRYNGPEITQILVDKSERKMYLLSGKKTIRKFKIDLGFSPAGHKQKFGDGRTPEGLYYIDRVNTNSRYYLSLGLNYPNANDRALADAAGVDPGGDIFIHGGPRYKGERGKRDWTAGCIAVSDKQMGWIYSMVKKGTPIFIKP